MSGYIGTQPVPQATQTRDSFTATSGQTSFATGGYTPNFLDVYLNGVKLASADYTATNGSDVVLASGAATGDILEVVAFTTFNSASSSIDDNGNATAITIDSSESVLIGKTALGVANAGFAVRNFGTGSGGGTTIELAKDDATAMYINRTSSDGTIIDLRKDGTSVGSIGAHSSGTYLGTADTGIYFNSGNDSIDPYNPSVPINRDNAISLGAGSRRFKDAYLSGGVYLGGTGSANKLDDYEYGAWSPVYAGATSAGTYTYVENQGHYVKIGNQVTCWFNLTNITTVSAGAGVAQLNGLPFTVDWMSGFNGEGVGIFSALGFVGINGVQAMPILHDNQTYVRLYKLSNSNNLAASINVTDKVNSGSDLRGFVTYTVSG